MSLNTAAYALVYWGLLRWAISPLGPEVNASLGIGFSALEGFTWPVFHGVSLAVASLVGRYLGAGDPDLARQVGRMAFPLSTGLGLLSGLVFFVGAEPLCGLFTDDPAVLQASVLYARILAFSQLFVAWEALAEGVLAGAGDTRTVFWWSAPINALRIPLGILLAMNLGWGAAGVWWAINLTSIVKALAKGAAAARGRWAGLEI
jgi:MATE family multidrug resistance protein